MEKERSWVSENWQKLLAGGFWLAILGGYIFYSQQHNLSPLGALQELTGYLRTAEFGPLIFIALYTVRPVFLFSAALLTIGAGALFGPLWGGIYSIVGSNLGASLAYFIGRFFGEGLLQSKRDDSKLDGWLEGLRSNSFETVFLMRLAFLPYDLVNYLAGILRINFWAFLTATALGSIPGTISFVLFGAASGLESGSPRFDWRIFAASLAIFGISVGISKLVKKRPRAEEAS